MKIEVRTQRNIAQMIFRAPRESNRSIARAVGVSANTVDSLRQKLSVAAKSWDELSQLDDDAWARTLGTEHRGPVNAKPAPDYAWVQGEMLDPDATLEQVLRKFRTTTPDGIGYSQFTAGYRAWIKSQHITMRIVHRPGANVFVDFCGRTVEIRDPDGGPSKFAKVFVSSAGHSSLIFATVVESEKIEDWITCHVEMHDFYGGVFEWVVPDNLKSAVTKRTRDEIILNPAYKYCLSAYGTAAMPAKPRKPKEKSKAEVSVQIVQRFALYPLRDRKFYSIEEARTAVQERVNQVNQHEFRNGSKTSRIKLFNEVERAALKPLPVRPYQFCEYLYHIRVGQDHHVPLLGSFYSVPFGLTGSKVDIKYSKQFVEFFHKGGLVASHQRVMSRGEYVTNDQHRPIGHRRVLEGEPRALSQWAKTVGPYTDQMIEHHLQNRADLTNGLKTARQLRALAREHGDERFEEVSRYALGLNIVAIRNIRSIFATSSDKRSAPAAASSASRDSHPNVRGPEYYARAEEDEAAE